MDIEADQEETRSISFLRGSNSRRPLLEATAWPGVARGGLAAVEAMVARWLSVAALYSREGGQGWWWCDSGRVLLILCYCRSAAASFSGEEEEEMQRQLGSSPRFALRSEQLGKAPGTARRDWSVHVVRMRDASKLPLDVALENE